MTFVKFFPYCVTLSLNFNILKNIIKGKFILVYGGNFLLD